ncbi:hypothetical protein ACODYM_29065 [Burkholderia gladioli]|uniref:hypothetical protein n=1 Tax=Burkholderia gladioli TaxID=28095 RepID=UPI003B502F0A
MRNLYQFAVIHSREIRDIVREHKFDQPEFIDDVSPRHDLTLLVRPVGRPTLLDMAAIVDEFEERWGMRVYLVTPDALSPEDERLVRPLMEAKSVAHGH